MMNFELENRISELEEQVSELNKLVELQAEYIKNLRHQLAIAEMPIEMWAARFNK